LGSDAELARAIGGATRTVGVIGWPVDHSLSPAIHNAAFAALGLDWVYIPLPVQPGAVREALRGLVALGLRGANVTMPHKTAAAEVVDELGADAERLAAVNTVIVREGRLVGENTDAPGFVRVLHDDAGWEARGRRALVLGAGGAARACVLALVRAGVGAVVVAARDPARAAAIRALGAGEVEVEVVGFEEAERVRTDLVVNATPLGAAGEEPPHPPLAPGMLVVDLLYRPRVTPLVAHARQAGADALGGLGLLLHQAALSFELWTGIAPPLEAMSAAALHAMADAPDDRPS
jgi:shikimate dehydrogenase